MMIYTCECGKTYKTERGFNKHNGVCSFFLSSMETSTTESEVEDITEEIEDNNDLMSKLCPKLISMKVEDNEDDEDDEDEICYSKADFIMRSVYEKKMRYLQKQLFKQHLPKKRIKSYRKMIKKLNRKTIV